MAGELQELGFDPTELTQHALCAALPKYSEGRSVELRTSLKNTNGPLVPIALRGMEVLDGWNRLQRCIEENIPLRERDFDHYDDLDDQQIVELVKALNFHRRHMSMPEMIAAGKFLAEEARKLLRDHPEITNREAARRLGTTPTTVEKRRREVEAEPLMSTPGHSDQDAEITFLSESRPLPHPVERRMPDGGSAPGRKRNAERPPSAKKPKGESKHPARSPEQLRADKILEIDAWIGDSDDRVWDILAIIKDKRPKQAVEMLKKLAAAWGVSSELAA